ncbi:phosphoglycerate dehydrogenase [Secundilactobacillus kimchicus]|uniref:D-3-phosphoglycerate dehydrogenase n=1 Tax=Secundilactobacillus kimchicus JCM 15530 TaxID=1302272 RepID=A0A0R1HVS6_9LACO|nr:phosphoglycerate dehydrogenase [Secundilactobacillus kimchicus]KRK48675.1 D-3-phosphoglycerate dehydrogenase [Secundilactobacillus kimchicus JCM 15530]
MTQKVIVPANSIALTDDYLRKQGYDVIEVADPTPDAILSAAPDVAGIVMLVAPFPNTLYDQLPNLRVLARYGVGYDNIDADFAATKGVWVTNTPGANAVSVAESAVTDMLIMAKHAVQVTEAMRQGENATFGGGVMGRELSGATVGIVGYGNIGQMVAKMLRGFGGRTLIYNRTQKPTEDGTYVDWETLFRESDFITVHLAAVPETEKLIGAKEFAMMKSSAILVNLARGSILDEPALIQALSNHAIGGAALDVFTQEPLPATSPLFGLDNVYLTPHTAANTLEAHQNMAMGASKMVADVLSGHTPKWAVNKPV